MNICWHIFRTINLDYPVDCRKINSTRCDIRRKKNSMLLFDKLKVNCCTFVLVLFTVQFHQIWANFERFEGLICKTDLLSWWEKDEDLLLLMRLQETKQDVKFVLYGDFHVIVEQSGRSNRFQCCIFCIRGCIRILRSRYFLFDILKVMNLNVLKLLVLKSHARQLFHRFRNSCWKEKNLHLFWQICDNLVNIPLKTHIQNSVNLVNYQHLTLVSFEKRIFVHMLQETSWSGNHNIHRLQVLSFDLDIFASNHESGWKIMQTGKRSQNLKSLHAKFTCGYKNQASQPIHLSPTFSIKTLDKRNQIGKGFARSCPRTTNQITSFEGVRYGCSLNFGHLDKLWFEKATCWHFWDG